MTKLTDRVTDENLAALIEVGQNALWVGIARELLARRAAMREMVAALEIAHGEFNAIRARDGAPQHIDWYRGAPMQTDSVTHEAWDQWTEQIYAALLRAKEIDG